MGRHSKVESDVEDDAQVKDSIAYRPEDDFGARPTSAEAGNQEG
jgi:hypothetical protein